MGTETPIELISSASDDCLSSLAAFIAWSGCSEARSDLWIIFEVAHRLEPILGSEWPSELLECIDSLETLYQFALVKRSH